MMSRMDDSESECEQCLGWGWFGDWELSEVEICSDCQGSGIQ